MYDMNNSPGFGSFPAMRGAEPGLEVEGPYRGMG
jgi:hypothetical protein